MSGVHSPDGLIPSETEASAGSIWAAFEADVLAYDPFAGDFGGSDDQPFVDKMVTARKPHPECHCCAGPIQMGERHRYKCDKYDGELMSWRWCWACCVAMARSWLPWTNHDAAPPYQEIEDRFGQRLRSTSIPAASEGSVGTQADRPKSQNPQPNSRRQADD
ncbi:hypothetical protein IWC96_14660 [Brevundimonas sp. BAL450]|uniref:hypothetical protein n=1 Tax=Brevundimonas sp. BAL450 TaxID=1708162 RepID=UPI0018CA6FE1|nr:hypothetical protein [Brevundimonas sp. BAL450]MBG7616517.1 hypothetical protein [Brevundimonas sp. BAL450]